MDNLVLIRVSAALNRSLPRSVLRDFHQENDYRFRLVLERDGRPVSVILSLEPARPWIGRPVGLGSRSRVSPGPFAARCNQVLSRRVLLSVAKGRDRSVAMQFVDGPTLVAELVPHRANIVLLDGHQRLLACARSPRSRRLELTPGAVYRPPGLPPNSLDPADADPREIDSRLEQPTPEGGDPARAMSRALFGVSAQAAKLVIGESRATGRSPGQVLAQRVASLLEGSADPVIAGPERTLPGAGRAGTDPERWSLLPWEPGVHLESPTARIRLEDPAATAGQYYGALERLRESENRGRSLQRILASEVARQRRAESRIANDLAGFEDPDRYRVQAEALLAGLHHARRSGDHALVNDPYDPSGRSISVPAPARLTLQQAADRLFREHRRARRGKEQARERAERVAGRRERLERILARFANAVESESPDALERAMREEGIAVGLASPRGKRALAGPPSKPRVEGVRLFTGPEGQSILVGKGGKENDRLTFKLAGPEDFWFHALGVPGAHVVVRNDSRANRPSRDVLRRAAAVAAWYSDARSQAQVDVQWTRRKYVRRLKGAGPGTVKVKKSETVRVRPGLPKAADESPK